MIAQQAAMGELPWVKPQKLQASSDTNSHTAAEIIYISQSLGKEKSSD